MADPNDAGSSNGPRPSSAEHGGMALSPLNGPLEIGLRILMVLTEAFPAELDLNQLVLLDHVVLHSGDIGGPESLHPAVPLRVGEMSVKRDSIEAGMQLLVRLGLARISVTVAGVHYTAGDSAQHFVDILGSTYSAMLRSRTSWALERFADLSEETLRGGTKALFDSWSEEFHAPDQTLSEDEGPS
ncbi:ABC-three component system middle component 2 [Mycobacterium sp. pW049]|uniref:ABC-three component system middle component 2 n=1 Tax=[Mycobacterium] bulgaricum TaxID=3238985 RepID=UPI00351BA4A5